MIGALATVPISLKKRVEELEIWERRETIQTKAQLKSDKNTLKSPEDLWKLHFDFNEKPFIKSDEKNLDIVKF